MFGISFEHILIIGVVLLLFGPKRLPDLGKSLGLSIKNFKDAFSGIERDQKPEDRAAQLDQKEPKNEDESEKKS
jgi:sec-independent protein translocase protein TatA